MKSIIPLFLTLSLASNYSYSANYSAYIPLENISSNSNQHEPNFPEINLPKISQNIEMDVFSGSITSGSHPYINSISASKGANEIIYNVNSKTRLNFSMIDKYDSGGNYVTYILVFQNCTNLGNSYNCVFKITNNSEGYFDLAGNELDSVYDGLSGYSNLFFAVINVSN